MKRRILAALLAAFLTLALTAPMQAAGAQKHETPAEYNENDYQKLVAFLDAEDENGIKNGEKLSADYDPENPDTWTDGAGAYFSWWWDGSEYRLEKICSDGLSMVGALDLSGCEMLDEVNMADARLVSIDLTGTNVEYFGTVEKEGAGSLAFIQTEYQEEDCVWFCGAAVAVPDDGAEFIGWFSEQGEHITSDLVLCGPEANTEALTARFTAEGEEYSYNAADCEKLRAFLETEDANGVKNGAKLSQDYSPDDPSSWSCAEWRYVSGELYLRRIDTHSASTLVGAIDVSGCVRLESLSCGGSAGITAINVTGCTSLETVSCPRCGLTELALTGCSAIDSVSCSYNPLESLDVSDCPELVWLYCEHTPIAELDLSNNPRVSFDRISAEGSGSIGVYYVGAPMWAYFAVAYPEDGAAFLGWYDENGSFITDQPEYGSYAGWGGGSSHIIVTARFESLPGTLPGDADSDGAVTLTDALLVLRGSMGLIQLSDEALASCDVNGDGSVDAVDALLILRRAMGLLTK